MEQKDHANLLRGLETVQRAKEDAAAVLIDVKGERYGQCIVLSAVGIGKEGFLITKGILIAY